MAKLRERDAVPTLSKCLLPSCVRLQKDTCNDAKALDFLLKTFGSWGCGWLGVPAMYLLWIWVGESSASWSRFLLMALGPCSPTICLLYPSLVIYLDTICCSMCAVGKRAAGRRLFFDRALREQPQCYGFGASAGSLQVGQTVLHCGSFPACNT